MYTSRVHGHVHDPSCTWQVGLPGLFTRSQTARDGRVRPVTAVYTVRSQLVHGSVYGRVRRPLYGRPTRAYVYTAVKRPCTHHVHVRVHGQYTVVYMAGRPTRPCTLTETARYGVGRVQGRNGPCTRSCTRPIHSRVHVRLHGTGRVHGRVHGPYAVTGRIRP